MNHVASARSLLLSEEESLEGATTLSLETCPEQLDYDAFTYIHDNFAGFLALVNKHLTPLEADKMICYYILSKTQMQLAKLMGRTQTVISLEIRRAWKKLLMFMTMGEPDEASLRTLFARLGHEDGLPCGMSRVVAMFMRPGTGYYDTAKSVGLPRAQVRRAINRLATVLMDGRDSQGQMVGSWMHSRTDKMNAWVDTITDREAAKHTGCIRLSDPDILGQFVQDINDPEFTHCFAPTSVK